MQMGTTVFFLQPYSSVNNLSRKISTKFVNLISLLKLNGESVNFKKHISPAL